MSTATPCQSSNCPNGRPPSKLECPTCHKLGIKGSFFCGQECFKAGWKTHKLIHDLATPKQPLLDDPNINKDGTFNPFGNFKFTGPLRPVYPLPDYAEDGQPTSESRQEQEKMRTVCRLGREILDIAGASIRPGITTDEIDEIVHNETIKRNAYPSTLNYRGYPKSVCTSVNETICHGIPDKRKLQEGDIINIDISLYYEGFHGDLNATYPVGRVDDDSKKLMRVTREALDEAIKICKPGALFRDLGKVIEPIARTNGCSVIRTYCGHGIHEMFHCAPNVPHYAKNKAVGTMKAGMVFTIEPMINLGTTGTSSTGRTTGLRPLITETGVEVLTAGKRREDLYG
ncbi:methionine aminopeptidase [Fomitopsis serialis]|uniref:methionine aminopeptidase n=1 Tax=Fomitopsis serialis TaxID=139415 RepID=UPI002007867D|nr:methionine aminopeptidase [Neoantrodia serialis]KAH9934781.1 methionine aminopeptidase [Neoantrodia serialis]